MKRSSRMADFRAAAIDANPCPVCLASAGEMCVRYRRDSRTGQQAAEVHAPRFRLRAMIDESSPELAARLAKRDG